MSADADISNDYEIIKARSLVLAATSLNLRRRVLRLLGESVRNDDLATLFLYLRDRSDNRASVKEIGDFVAHRAEREKGVVTAAARDFFLTFQFLIPGVSQPYDATRLPANFYEFLQANLRCIPSRALMENTGLKRMEAQRKLKLAQNNFVKNHDNTVSILPILGSSEFKLIKFLSSILSPKNAFSLDELFDDFTKLLRSNSLLIQNEIDAFRAIKPAIGLYAISVMHKCHIRIDGEKIAFLTAWPNSGEKRDCLGVLANISVKFSKLDEPSKMCTDMFMTDLISEKHCNSDLLGPSNIKNWDDDLEIGQDGLLSRI